jgi:RNase P/RNase MRP subunit POP5
MKLSLEQIIKQYPKTDDCELQTLGQLHEWQLEQLRARDNYFAKEIIRILDKKANKGVKNKIWEGFTNGLGEEVGKDIDSLIIKAKKQINREVNHEIKKKKTKPKLCQ